MTEVKKISDKGAIYSFLSRNPELYLYLIGDLDDFFWPHTEWFSLVRNNTLLSVALFYKGIDPGTLLVFHEGDPGNSIKLISSIRCELPGKFNVHLSPGLIDVFGRENILADYGNNFRMILKKMPEPVTDTSIRRLGSGDIEMILRFYTETYPDNWFDPRMTETGKYFGYFDGDRLAGIAGIHVFSAEYRIAALGNIATHPGYRGRKIAFKLTSALCNDLRNETDTIGLNVKSDNQAAIRCYKNSGFEITASYNECLVKNR